MALRHSPYVVTDGLVFYLDPANPRCYTSGTTAYDLSKAGLTDSVSWTGTTVVDGAFLFNGSTDWISLGADSPNNFYTTAFTFECWIKKDGAGSDAYCVFMGTRYGVNYQIGQSIGTGYLGVLMTTSPTGNYNFPVSTTPDIFDDNWHHVTGTFNNGTAIIYVNANQVGSDVARAGQDIDVDNTRVIGIGGDDTVGRNFDGYITSIKIYNRDLTLAEIQQNYNAMKRRFGV